MANIQAQIRFKKAVALAKQLRKKNSKLTYQEAIKLAFKKLPKKVGAVKIIQKGESKNAKVTKVLEQTRGKKGYFKGYKRISGIGYSLNKRGQLI